MKYWIVGIWFLVLSAAGVAVGAEPASTAQIKEQLVKLLANITMTLNHAVDEPFCRQFFEDFRKQDKKVEHVQPIMQVDRFDDPALTAVVGKCPTVKWIGADAEEPGNPLNSMTYDRGRSEIGTAHFRLYKVDINNNRKDGAEHVFYMDGYVPEPLPGENLIEVEELDKTRGHYVVVDFEHCLSLGGVEVGRVGMQVRPVYHGIIRYQGRSYIYDLNASGGYKLYLNELTTRQETFKTICRYWQ